jgi:hypothetical protein
VEERRRKRIALKLLQATLLQAQSCQYQPPTKASLPKRCSYLQVVIAINFPKDPLRMEDLPQSNNNKELSKNDLKEDR